MPDYAKKILLLAPTVNRESCRDYHWQMSRTSVPEIQYCHCVCSRDSLLDKVVECVWILPFSEALACPPLGTWRISIERNKDDPPVCTSLQQIMTSKTRYLKVKLDCLQQNSFQSHHLLSWVLVNIIVIRNSEPIPMKKSKCCVSVEAPAWKCWTEHHWSDSWLSWSNPWKGWK